MRETKTGFITIIGFAVIFCLTGIVLGFIQEKLTANLHQDAADNNKLSSFTLELSKLHAAIQSKYVFLSHLKPALTKPQALETERQIQTINQQIKTFSESFSEAAKPFSLTLPWSQLNTLVQLNPMSEPTSSPDTRPPSQLHHEYLHQYQLLRNDLDRLSGLVNIRVHNTSKDNARNNQSYYQLTIFSWLLSLLIAGALSTWLHLYLTKQNRLLGIKQWRAEKIAQRMRQQARRDSLTNLPNRDEFHRHLQKSCYEAEKNGTNSCLIFVDLDQFKVVNDTCGHSAGDHLLREISYRMHHSLDQKAHLIARLGGDEFAVLLSGVTLAEAKQSAQTLMNCIREHRFLWEGRAFEIGASMGIVPITKDYATPREVMSAADTACYIAKDEGRNRIKILELNSKDLDHRLGEMNWAQELTHAIRENRLELYAQEIIPIKKSNRTNRRRQFEFLVRLKTHNGKTITPAAFIPVAERYSIANQLDRWVLAEAFRWIEKLSCRNKPCEGLEDAEQCRFSINLSGQSISDPDLLEFVISLIEKHQLAAKQVCFEITETAVITNMTQATRFIHQLKKLGCLFALDDFGSGMSSFAYLIDLEVDTLKIDGSLVRNAATDPVKFTMLRSIVEIAKVMKLCTVAEFVEDEKTLRSVSEAGIDFAQGYHLHRPQQIAQVLGQGCQVPRQPISTAVTETNVVQLDASISA